MPESIPSPPTYSHGSWRVMPWRRFRRYHAEVYHSGYGMFWGHAWTRRGLYRAVCRGIGEMEHG